MKLSDFDLTTAEMEMLSEALDLLAKDPGMPGIFEIIGTTAAKMKDEDSVDDIASRIRNSIKAKAGAEAEKKERIRILQGKNLMVKRNNQEEDTIDKFKDIINKPDDDESTN